MLVSYRWLKEYTDIPWSPQELAERLTMSGAKVEGVHTPDNELAGVVVGLIRTLERHPEADKLSVCSVDVGDKVVTVITGAPNAKAGTHVPVALPGATLPGTDTPVQAVSFRGIRSEGVLCSEAELQVGDDASGLMLLTDEARPGTPLATVLGLDDAVIEFEIYPNRPDCLSVVGIAREVSALTGASLHLPAQAQERRGRSGPAVEVRVQAPDLCPRYCCQVVENVTVGPSPLWMQQRLRAAGMRPINNVVDVTNFVMLELGQPLHAFDLEKLEGPVIIVRRAEEGESITTIDGTDANLPSDALVIADKARPVALAGIMGGANSEVGQATRHVLLEAATFHPTSVRRTARRMGMRTEASNRFEKGLDVNLPLWALERAAQLLAEVAGGDPSPQISDAAQPVPEERRISLRPERVNHVLGTDLSVNEMKRTLRALHLCVDETGDGRLQVDIPSSRGDLEREIDLIEEVARIHGYENIPSTLPTGMSSHGGQNEPLPQLDQLRHRLTAAGVSEAMTYSFMSPRSLGHLRLPEHHLFLQAIPILNPLSEEQSLLRTTLLPNLLEVLARNARRQAASVRLFEIGSVFHPKALPLTTQPQERPTLGIALMGEQSRTGFGDPEREVDFYDLKGLVEAALAVLGVAWRPVAVSDYEPFHPGRCAGIECDGVVVGHFGEVHPDVLDAFDISRRALVAEIALSPLLGRRTEIRYSPIPRHPAVQRDLALLAPLELSAERIERVIRQEGEPLLQDVHLFDVYQGKQVPAGYRSLAYALVIQAPDRTLTDDEVLSVQQRILARLESDCGVRVRG